MRLRRVMLAVALGAALGPGLSGSVLAADPVKTYVEECGACHVPFPPDLLPARSWNRLTGNLADHFGEDASIDADTRALISGWLDSQAADTGGTRRGRWVMRGVGQGQAPLRITETRTWVRAHDEVSPWRWRSDEVKSKANCLACHRP